MTSHPPSDSLTRTYEVAIVGNDMLLAALPARPVQLAHAVLACGFDLVVPVSWGEEAIAYQALQMLESWGSGPAILCACPSVLARLMAAGRELAPYLISLVPGPVATARYLRALQPSARMQITFLGTCPGGGDPSIDVQLMPAEFLRHMRTQGILVDQQPSVFDSVVPPDRRRYYSLPGGCPSRDVMLSRDPERRLVSIDHPDFVSELADRLLRKERVLIDLAAPLACACCGGGSEAVRAEVALLEPPRSAFPVIDHEIDVPLLDLDATAARGFDAALRTPVAGPRQATTSRPAGLASREGVHAIEHARRRGESRRIAVTPPHAVVAFRSDDPVPASMYKPDATRVPLPADVVASPEAPVVLTDVSREPRPAQSSDRSPTGSGSALPMSSHTSTEVLTASAPSSSSPRGRTTAHETLRRTRVASHVRINTGEGPALPRAYVAIRARPVSASGVAATAPSATVPATALTEVERQLDVSVEPESRALGTAPEAIAREPRDATISESGATVRTVADLTSAQRALFATMRADGPRSHRAIRRHAAVPPRRSPRLATALAIVASAIAVAALAIAAYALFRR